MMNTNLKDSFSDIPNIIRSPYEMRDPNQTIKIFEGEFKLNQNGESINLFGEIYFNWIPDLSVRFNGKISANYDDLDNLLTHQHNYQVIVNEIDFGEAILESVDFSNETLVKGIIHGTAVLGDKSIPVTKINFTIPNLREFFGENIKIQNENGFKFSKNRITIENDDYIIEIDKSLDFKELFKKLRNSGGYVILYSGELRSKKGSIFYSDIDKLIQCFSKFISFLNGRRSSLLFIQGVHVEEVIWTDYTGRFVDQYKYVSTWPQQNSTEGLNELWKNFSALWENENDRDCLKTSIHWYVEANSNSGFLEGSIVMAQTCLELIYNWIIIEKRKLLLGNDAANISASNKIRLLLSKLQVSLDVPVALSNLQSYINNDNIVEDGVDAFVQIRNQIIHSQEAKRKKLLALYEMKHCNLQYGI